MSRSGSPAASQEVRNSVRLARSTAADPDAITGQHAFSSSAPGSDRTGLPCLRGTKPCGCVFWPVLPFQAVVRLSVQSRVRDTRRCGHAVASSYSARKLSSSEA
eukprot:5409888-Prymnesium_polylepis.2